MKIATWNVNSLRVRLEHLLRWLDENPVDAIGIQETKVTDDKFPVAELADAGWHAVFAGQKTYNGVAILSREPLSDWRVDLPDFADEQKRLIAANIGALRLINVYAPNGSEVGSDKYAYKLAWLDALNRYVRAEMAKHEHLVLLGDFNIAPRPEDTHDPDYWEGRILCSEAERQRFAALLQAGLVDCMSRFEHGERERFTWWDYRGLGFQLNKGLRIDHVLASAPLAERCTGCGVDKTPRKWNKPSDHAPVIAEFAD